MTTEIYAMRQNVAACMQSMDIAMKTERQPSAEESVKLIKRLELVADFLANLQAINDSDEQSQASPNALTLAKEFIEGVVESPELEGSLGRTFKAREVLAAIEAAEEEMTAPAIDARCVAITNGELAAFSRFCETSEDGEGYDIGKEMVQRLAAIGLVRHLGRRSAVYETTSFGIAVREAYRGQPADAGNNENWSIEANDPYRRLTERKTNSIRERGYMITGYVLRNADRSHVCISEYSAVRWMGHKAMFNMMHCVPQSAISDPDLLAAFNGGHTVIDGLHQVLSLFSSASAQSTSDN